MPVAPVQPPLQELPREDGAVADSHHIADQHLAHAAGQRRRVVAHLIGMRKNHPLRGALVLDELMQGVGKSIRSVLRQQRMLHAHHLAYAFGGGFGGQRLGLRADDHGRDAFVRAQAFSAAASASQLTALDAPTAALPKPAKYS